MDIEAPNMAFGADFEPDTDNSDFNWINCHCLLTRRSSSKVCYAQSMNNKKVFRFFGTFTSMVLQLNGWRIYSFAIVCTIVYSSCR